MISWICKNTIVPMILRLALAAVFIYHGLDLVKRNDAWGANWHDDLPVIAQIAVAWGQLLGGVALAFGFLTRLAALGITIIMAGAIYQVHWKNGFNLLDGGFEYNFVLISICLCLILGGPGPIAVDRVFHLRRRQMMPPPQQY